MDGCSGTPCIKIKFLGIRNHFLENLFQSKQESPKILFSLQQTFRGGKKLPHASRARAMRYTIQRKERRTWQGNNDIASWMRIKNAHLPAGQHSSDAQVFPRNRIWCILFSRLSFILRQRRVARCTFKNEGASRVNSVLLCAPSEGRFSTHDPFFSRLAVMGSFERHRNWNRTNDRYSCPLHAAAIIKARFPDQIVRLQARLSSRKWLAAIRRLFARVVPYESIARLLWDVLTHRQFIPCITRLIFNIYDGPISFVRFLISCILALHFLSHYSDQRKTNA